MDVEEQVRWTPEVGQRLKAKRGRMSKREAARRAGFSEATWRALELGVRRPAKGVEVPVNPTIGNLEAAALAVDEDPAELFRLVGLSYTGRQPAPEEDDTDLRLTRVEERLDRIDEVLSEVLQHLEPGR